MLQEHAKSLREQYSSWRTSKTDPAEDRVPWTGLGSYKAAQVEGLRNIKAVSLGGVHALALIDDDKL